jgi:hypothetical protein
MLESELKRKKRKRGDYDDSDGDDDDDDVDDDVDVDGNNNNDNNDNADDDDDGDDGNSSNNNNNDNDGGGNNNNNNMEVIVSSDGCTLLVIGQTGAGKSELGNAYLQSRAFTTDDGPSSVTFLTNAKQNKVAGAIRYCIDTQGLNDTEGVDTEHVQQMVQFMREWTKGANAIALVINGQAPRLDGATQKLIKIIHTFFNNPQFWNHVCLVFTKNYRNHQVNKNKFRTEYINKVQDIVIECIGNGAQRPQIPVFFVDSTEYNNDPETKSELIALHAFAIGLPPLPTQHVVPPDIRFMKIIPETRKKELINTRIVPYENNGRRKILTFEDQKREKRIDYDGMVTYSDWVGTRKWKVNEYEKRETEEELRVLVKENTTEAFTNKKYGKRRYGIAGPRRSCQVHDYWNVTKTYQDRKRTKITNFDNSVNYGDWEILRTYNETQKIK